MSEQNRAEWLKRLGPGDVVAVTGAYGRGHTLAKVERVTPTMISLPFGQKFSRETGRKRGSGYANETLVEPTAEVIAEVRRERLIARLKYFLWKDVPTEVLERVSAAVLPYTKKD